MTFSEKCALLRRAYRLTWELDRHLFLSKLLKGALEAAEPLVTVWFSARILEALTVSAQVQVLAVWAVAAVLGGAAITALKAFFTHRSQRLEMLYDRRFENLLAGKIMSMDFEDVEGTQARDLLTQIHQNENYNGLGLGRIMYELDGLMMAVTSVLGGTALTVSLFRSAATRPGFLWLNHPLAVSAVILAVLLSALLTARMESRHAALWTDPEIAAEIKQSNAMYIFLWQLPPKTKHGMDIRLYRMDRTLEEIIHRRMDALWTFYTRVYGKSAGYNILGGVGSTLCYGLTYLFVALKALGKAFGIGYVVQYVGAISQVATGISELGWSLSAMLSTAPYMATTFEFLDIPNKKYMGTLTVEKRSDNKYDVEFQDVSFKYPGSDTYALRHMNLKFRIGRKLAVVGMNGSGKTTMIKLLCRLYDPTEGEILLNGIDIRKYDYDEYMSLFSVVFQDFQLFSFPLGQNVASRVDYDRQRAGECLRLAGFGDRLASLDKGLDTYLGQDFDENGVEMSGGESQKIALARALYKNAPFMILDEPTAALDPLAEYEIYTKFNEIIGDHTAVYISHRLSSCRFCDEIAVFHEGQVIQFGTHESLLADTKGKYYELWNAQAQYYTKDA